MNENKILRTAADSMLPDTEQIRGKCLEQSSMEYGKKTKIGRTIWIKKAALSAICILIAVVAVIAMPLIQNSREKKIQTEPYPDNNMKSVESLNSNKNIIRINHIDGISDDRLKLNFDLNADDFISMSRTDLLGYYGINIFPEVSQDLTNWDITGEYKYGIYRNPEGEVYYDVNIINYSNHDFTKSLNIEVSKGKLPATDIAFFNNMEEVSRCV